jgi:hypothetical protein
MCILQGIHRISMKAKEEKKWFERILSIMMYDIEKMQINVLTEIPRMEQIHECVPVRVL